MDVLTGSETANKELQVFSITLRKEHFIFRLSTYINLLTDFYFGRNL